MIARLCWFALGVGVALWAVSKVRESFRRAAPQALGQRVVASASEVGESARGFTDRVRAAMAEREAELRAVLDQRGARSDSLGLPEPE